MVGVFLFGPMVNNNLCISQGAIRRNVSYFLVGEEEDNVGSFGDSGFPPCQMVYFLAHHKYPEIFQMGIFHQLTILCDGLFGDGVNNSKAVFLDDVNDGICPLRPRSCLDGLKVNVVNGLSRDVAGETGVDYTG
jgi:hypothetical protein